MALDPGTQRIGVAVSDELGLLASPVSVIQRRTRASDLANVQALIHEYRPQEVLIGLPLLPSGEAGPQARQSQAFAQLIQRQFGLPTRLWNESYSTVEADRRRRLPFARRRNDAVDAEAAAVFLQDYLDSRR